MRMQAMGPGAGWSWLRSGFTVAARNPGKILGAAVLLALCLALPALIQFAVKPRGDTIFVTLGAITLLSCVVYPILYGGFMRMLDADRNGRAFSAFGIFEPFRPGRGGSRLALFGVCMLVAYVVFFAIVLATIGRAVGPWYLHVATLQNTPFAPVTLPPAPAGTGITVILAIVFFLFYSGALAVGTGQVALRDASAWNGFRDGVAGSFKNALPLVVLAVCTLVALFIAAIGLGILVAVLFLLGHFVGTSISLILTGLLYVVFMLLIVTLMMGINYAMWRDVAGGAADGSAGAPVPGAEA